MSVASSYERQMLDLINAERAARGIDPLTLELRLNDASEDHSAWMDDALVFSHTGAGGSDPGDRMRDAGFVFSGSWTWGENIAMQSERGAPGLSDDVIDLHNSLMNSSGHRANILNPNFEVIGIGIEVGDNRGFDAVYVTQAFARTDAPLQLDTSGGTPPPPPPEDAPEDPVITDQVLTGNGQDNTLDGGAGDDTITGRRGDDTLSGLAGDDEIRGQAGADAVNGGTGADRLYGNQGNDTLSGGSGKDLIVGAAGHDELIGGNDRDRLNGGSGNDMLDGGDGPDRLDGGFGNDLLIGGGAADLFVFTHGQDVAVDFDPGQRMERVDFRGTSRITDFDDLMDNGHIYQTAQGTMIDDLYGNTLLLHDVSLDTLQSDDFLF
ncbi:MAG: CAP domain-containing protein [Roseovarius sp.]